MDKDGREVRVQYVVNDATLKRARRYEKTFLDTKSIGGVLASMGGDGPGMSNCTVSSSGRWTAITRGTGDELDKKPSRSEEDVMWEVWSETGMRGQTNCGKAHGAVCWDDRFGRPCWTPDEHAIVYAAEARYKAPAAFFSATAEESTRPGDANVYRETWGETLGGYVSTRVFVADVRPGGSVRALCDEDALVEALGCSEFSLGQPCVLVDGSVAFVAWPHLPRKLGQVYCVNRRSFVCVAGADGCSVRVVSRPDEDYAVLSPRAVPDRRAVVYLAFAEKGPHNQCASLRLVNVEADPVHRALVDIVEAPEDDAPFTGIYSQCLPARCFVRDGPDSWRIVLSTYVRSQLVAVSVGMGTANDVHRIAVDVVEPSGRSEDVFEHLTRLGDAAVDVLDCEPSCGAVLAAVSSFSLPPVPVLVRDGKVRPLGAHPRISVDSRPLDELLRWRRVMLHADRDAFEAVVVLPASASAASPAPVLLVPHGGPHSVYAVSWFHNVALYASRGMAVVLVNYRGSIGFGARALRSLGGAVGINDVADCMAAFRAVLDPETHPEARCLDSSRAGVCGGSHGGFLAGHLAGQHPEHWLGAALWNPVVDMSAMQATTDIVEWVLYEGCGEDDAVAATPEDVARLFSQSPIAHVDRIAAPVLLTVGLDDKRVPPEQPRQLYRRLCARGHDVQMVVYEANAHAIACPNAHADAIAGIATFFVEKFQIRESNT